MKRFFNIVVFLNLLLLVFSLRPVRRYRQSIGRYRKTSIRKLNTDGTVSIFAYPNTFGTQTVFANKSIVIQCVEDLVRNNSELAARILGAFKYTTKGLIRQVLQINRPPFIVIEASLHSRTRKVASMLAENMGAKYIETPPGGIGQLWNEVKHKTMERTVYNSLSVYAAEYKAKKLLSKNHPVVMKGYWFSMISNVIGKLWNYYYFPRGHEIYKEPQDLMMPDLAVYVDFHQEKLEKHIAGIVARKGRVFGNFPFPRLVLLTNPNGSDWNIANDLTNILVKHLEPKHQKYLSFHPRITLKMPLTY
uniref:Uncharacterized protein n=1 Tax=Clastoptera arizonana TaxID=38151 RepID=A0A1B6ECE9_9HEMI